ncbi:hypothetical protein ELI30_27250 (plasmid) [Rhizobium leguminosarum]|uniref:hypothetical protein n=1 Tax=Rhizobium TaxID=379 RepID=UPI0010303C8A|nr:MULTISPECIES: hypothetical protein [Rhizobium]TBY62803.1 hypothetical protein E0H46_26800 [Rhizobium leguminosarum bv. viciae]NEH83053.1 hypothetical protein [Rhizobium ruizarguesonis]TAV45352.1 hypothetical protein ELI31_26170 [Rhizobium leguminosarum]TAV45910.1 hypothetical protein ELI32_27480 [Rhizobium leguminosarum]TAV63765.1 hypothetical protein ELI30_27250 [Rhizobium leguminosarum]
MASGLTDMEELLGRVSNPAIADYLKEALACYGTGAHRACIVMTFIAVFEDLRTKTKLLATLNTQARAISRDIETLANGQKPFETKLVERLQSNELISELQGQRLKQIISHRNKAAHPSGHHASAEEARYVFFEAIDKYLRHPALSTNHAVDRIIERFSEANYFPDNNMTNIRAVVREEVSGIHPEAYDYLAIKVVGHIGSADATANKNARFFMSGMAAIDESAMRKVVMEQFVAKKSSDPVFGDEIAATLSSGPKMIEIANSTTKSRLNSLIEKVTEGTESTVPITRMKHPITLIGAMISKLDESTVFPTFQGSVDKILDKYWRNPTIIDAVSSSTKAFKQLRRLYLEKAGSSDFATANDFAAALPDLDQKLAEKAPRQFAVQVLGSVCVAAQTGAYKAKPLRSSKFASIGALRAKAIDYIDEKPDQATKALKKIGIGGTAADFKADYLAPPDADQD